MHAAAGKSTSVYVGWAVPYTQHTLASRLGGVERTAKFGYHFSDDVCSDGAIAPVATATPDDL